jgi:cation transport ATPase
METVFSSNLKCGSCVDKVTPHLDAITEIKSWHVDTENPQKLLTVSHNDASAIELVQAGISQAGFRATPLSAEQVAATAVVEAKPPFDLSNYKPLALVFLYVVGLTAYSEWLADEFSWSRVMSLFMGYFFLAFAFFKLLDVAAFATSFATYDILAKRSRSYALAYPFVELLLGMAFLSGRMLTVTNIATVLVMSVGLIGVMQALRKKQAIQCACLGTAFNLPMSVVTVVENGVMITMALVMLVK